MANKGETSIAVWLEQWETFFEKASSYDLRDEKERNFVNNFLQPDENNKLWLQTFRDCLSEALNFAERSDHALFQVAPVPDQEAYLKNALKDAIDHFNDIKKQLSKIAKNKRNDSQKQFLLVEVNETAETSLPLTVVIDIGRLLGFYRMPKTESWIMAGRSYQCAQFLQNLYNARTGLREELYSEDNADESGYAPPASDDDEGNLESNNSNEADDHAVENDDNAEKFKPNSTASTYLRLCTQKIWCEMLSGDKAVTYSNRLLISEEPVKKAIALFNEIGISTFFGNFSSLSLASEV